MFLRILYFSILVIFAIFVTPLLVVPLVFFYAMSWYALEILVLGYLFDVYFGVVSNFPYFTIGALVIILSAEIAKKYLMIKTSTR